MHFPSTLPSTIYIEHIKTIHLIFSCRYKQKKVKKQSESFSNIGRLTIKDTCKQMISDFDSDEDGYLSTLELGNLSGDFAEADTDGDGLFSQDELVASISAKLTRWVA